MLVVNVTINSGICSYLFLFLTMWPVFITLCLGMSIAFYGVLMPKTAIACLVIAAAFGIGGWFYGL
ncbi:hypothetical protein AAH414_14305 [Klebsiella pneumoniae]